MLALLIFPTLYYAVGLKNHHHAVTHTTLERGGFLFSCDLPRATTPPPHVPWEHHDKRFHPLFGSRIVDRGQVSVVASLLATNNATQGFVPGTAVVRLPCEKTFVAHTRPLAREQTEVFWALYTRIPYSPIARFIHGRLADRLLEPPGAGDKDKDKASRSARLYRDAYLARLLGENF